MIWLMVNTKTKKKTTQSEKVLKDKAFAIANNPKYDGYQRELASMVYKFFDKNSKGSGIKNEIKETQQLVNEVYYEIVKKEKCILHLKTVFGVLI